MHKGHIEMRLTIAGRGAHSAYPHLGENAIEPVGDAIVALREFRQHLESEGGPQQECFPEVPCVSLNVAQVGGGTAVNIVPDRCTLDVGMRLLPGMDSAAAIARVRTVVSGALGTRPFQLSVESESPPMVSQPEAPIYRAVCTEVGQRATLSAAYATDAGWLQSLGLDCVIFGPGSIEVAHKPNEFIAGAEFRRGAGLLDRLIHRFCLEKR
jgi:acetylornithine deacetylase